MSIARRVAILSACVLAVFSETAATQSEGSGSEQPDNGIHVGAPKIYDSRELTLMLDDLSESLRNKQFVDPVALAKALGNTQGYQNTDFSQTFFANGAVGPEASSVFAGTLGSSSTASPSGSTSNGTSAAGLSPSVTINISPTQNAGTTSSTSTASTGSTSGSSGLGPQAYITDTSDHSNLLADLWAQWL